MFVRGRKLRTMLTWRPPQGIVAASHDASGRGRPSPRANLLRSKGLFFLVCPVPKFMKSCRAPWIEASFQTPTPCGSDSSLELSFEGPRLISPKPSENHSGRTPSRPVHQGAHCLVWSFRSAPPTAVCSARGGCDDFDPMNFVLLPLRRASLPSGPGLFLFARTPKFLVTLLAVYGYYLKG